MKLSQLLETEPTDKVWYGPKTFDQSGNYPQFFETEEDSEEVNYHIISIKVNLRINNPASNKDLVKAAAYVLSSGGKIISMHSDPKIKAALKAKLPLKPTQEMMAAAEEMFDQYSYAEVLAYNEDLRDWLVHEGFDGYIDYSVLFSQEPLQAIVFNPNQIKVVATA